MEISQRSRFILKELQPGKDSCRNKEKVSGGKSSKEKLLWTDHNPHSSSACTAQDGEKTEASE